MRADKLAVVYHLLSDPRKANIDADVELDVLRQRSYYSCIRGTGFESGDPRMPLTRKPTRKQLSERKMDSIRIRNLRSLSDTGVIEIKPLTVLVGKNSAGKSTFLRSFPLLRQSSEQKTINDILWFGDYVDFGSFSESVNRGEILKPERKEISFEFVFPQSVNDMINSRFYANRHGPDVELIQVCKFQLRQITETNDPQADVYSEYVVEIDGNIASLTVDQDLVIKNFVINGENITAGAKDVRLVRQKDLLPSLMWTSGLRDEWEKRIFKILRTLVHHNVSSKRIEAAVSRTYYGPDPFVIKQLLGAELGETFAQNVVQTGRAEEKVSQICRLLFAVDFARIFESINLVLSSTFSNVRYITPLRASAERYYRLQGLAVDEIAPNGENLAMYLKSLSDNEANEFAEWTKEYMGFAVRVESHAGHVSIVIDDPKEGTRVNLADVGFGYSQVIPILAQIWQIQRSRTKRGLTNRLINYERRPIFFLIEQPELHLHPKMQGRLAELFVRSSNVARGMGIDLRIIIETHSETIIAKFGQLVSLENATERAALERESAEVNQSSETEVERISVPMHIREVHQGLAISAHSNFSEETIGIYLFGARSDGKSGTEIIKSGFNKDGLLLDWPYDFFDGVQ
ncbi:AAA family ATPase [Paraburkholderia hospita]|uniref:AAA family ATPase n=1 Tax=Paraburkholderia hospita TaxID=169430 RepID=UPI000B3455CF|nr:AAA family ATPase [Paraburkholderia hospita]OUL72154.1 hypothetical protein CA603_46185 [Paraburkholderia hospita]